MTENAKTLIAKNTALATVGDAILKAILSDYFFSSNCEARKGEITKNKEKLENNNVVYEVMERFDLKQYTYNDYAFSTDPQKDHQKVGDSKHNQYIEAIVAAIYYAVLWVYFAVSKGKPKVKPFANA